MKFLRTASVLVLAAFALSACDDSTTGVTLADLAGVWTATQFEYIDNANPGFAIDAVSDAGGSVSLDVSDSGSFTGSISIPGLTVNPTTGETITVDIGGTISVNGDTLSIDFNAATEALGLFGDFDASFELNGDVLTFVNEDSSFDFPDALEEQAGIGARAAVSATLSTRFTR